MNRPACASQNYGASRPAWKPDSSTMAPPPITEATRPNGDGPFILAQRSAAPLVPTKTAGQRLPGRLPFGRTCIIHGRRRCAARRRGFTSRPMGSLDRTDVRFDRVSGCSSSPGETSISNPARTTASRSIGSWSRTLLQLLIPASTQFCEPTRALAKHLQRRHPTEFQAPDQRKRPTTQRTWDFIPSTHRIHETPGHSTIEQPI